MKSPNERNKVKNCMSHSDEWKKKERTEERK